MAQNKQEIIDSVNQSLQSADFTKMMADLLRTATNNVLKRSKENLAASLGEGTSSNIDAALQTLNNSVATATCEWIDQTSGHLVVFPEGTRFVAKDANSVIVLVEQKPQVRTISFREGQSRQYPVSLPYFYFLGRFASNRLSQLKVCCSPLPIQSLNDTIYRNIMPNMHGSHEVCLGTIMSGANFNNNIVDMMNGVIQRYWNSHFNLDLIQNTGEFFRINNLVSGGESFSTGFQAWANASRLNPLYAIQPTTKYAGPLRASSLIPSEINSRDSREATMTRLKVLMGNSVQNLSSSIIDVIRDYEFTDDNRERTHLQTLSDIYKRIITAAYSNLMQPIENEHNQMIQQFNQTKAQAEANLSTQLRTHQNNVRTFDNQKVLWERQRTEHENKLRIAQQYLQRKLQEVGSSFDQAVNPAPAPAAAPVPAPAPAPAPAPVVVGRIPNPPGFSGRGRKRMSEWGIGSVYRKKQRDGSYLRYMWNGREWVVVQ